MLKEIPTAVKNQRTCALRPVFLCLVVRLMRPPRTGRSITPLFFDFRGQLHILEARQGRILEGIDYLSMYLTDIHIPSTLGCEFVAAPVPGNTNTHAIKHGNHPWWCKLGAFAGLPPWNPWAKMTHGMKAMPSQFLANRTGRAFSHGKWLLTMAVGF